MGTRSRIAGALAFILTFLMCSPLPAQDAASASVPAARQADDVVIITVHGEIDRWMELSIKRRIEQAESSGADAIVFEIDSPGGEIGAVLEICNAIKGSTIANTVAWVHHNAYSGGAIVALACREIVTADPASMGDAFPITMSPLGVRGLSPDERTKFLPPLLTEVADSARRNGYDEFLVQAMVTDGIELWSVRDRDTGRLWFINEKEYRTLFGGDPPRGKPVLVSVTGGRASQQMVAPPPSPTSSPSSTSPPATPATPTPPAGDDTGATGGPDPDAGGAAARPSAEEETTSPDGAASPAGGDTTGTDTSPGVANGAGGEDTAFTPASPSVEDLTESASLGLTAPSARPVFTEADRGRFVDPRYICDGTGAIVLRDDQLREFGFSSATIQNDEQLRAYFGATRMIRTDQTWSEAMVRFLMHPVVRGVLIVILLLGLFVEMSSPGMILPGALAVGALVGLLAPPMLVGMAGWWEILALAIGVLCLLVEVFVVPGFGVFGVVGLVALFVGLVGTFIPDGNGGLFGGSEAANTGLLYGVTTVLLSTTTAGAGIFLLGKHFGTLPILNRLILDSTREDEDVIAAMDPGPVDEPVPGDRGTTVTPLRAAGRVRINGVIHDAVAERGYIEAGRPVEVVERRGFAWVVRPANRPTEPDETGGYT